MGAGLRLSPGGSGRSTGVCRWVVSSASARAAGWAGRCVRSGKPGLVVACGGPSLFARSPSVCLNALVCLGKCLALKSATCGSGRPCGVGLPPLFFASPPHWPQPVGSAAAPTAPRPAEPRPTVSPLRAVPVAPGTQPHPHAARTHTARVGLTQASIFPCLRPLSSVLFYLIGFLWLSFLLY